MQPGASSIQSRSRFRKLAAHQRNHSVHTVERKPFLQKLFPILLIALTTVLAVVLVILRNYRWTGKFFTLVTNNRATIGFFVQVIASTLGAFQVYALTQTISYTYRLYLQNGNPTSFKYLRFWISVVNANLEAVRLSWPKWLLTISLIIFVSLKVPGALWAGALTPTSTDVDMQQGQLQVATYPIEDLDYWKGSFRKYPNGTADMTLRCNWTISTISTILNDTTAATMISTCPSVDQASGLIGNLASASREDPRFHPRIDMAGWNYKGRSYGVGASPGVVQSKDLIIRDAPIQWISYEETGYDTIVTCQKNTSSAYISVGGPITTDTNTIFPEYLRLYQIYGQLPNSDPNVTESFVLTTNSPTNDFVNSFGWSALYNEDVNMLAVAGTGNHIDFNQTICTVEFVPSNFNVYINASDASIIVSKLNSTATDIEPTQQYARTVFISLEQLARMSSLTVASSLGQPLTRTYNVLKGPAGTPHGPGDFDRLAVKTIADGVTSLIDDLFVANAQSQLVLLNHSQYVPLTVNYFAVRLGSTAYLYAVLTTNLLILLIVMIEAARTKFWKGLNDLDFSDVPGMAIAASVGGKSIALASGRQSTIRTGGAFANDIFSRTTSYSHDAAWTTESQDVLISGDGHEEKHLVHEDDVQVRLRKEPRSYALISATQGQYDDLGLPTNDSSADAKESHRLVEMRLRGSGSRTVNDWHAGSDGDEPGDRDSRRGHIA